MLRLYCTRDTNRPEAGLEWFAPGAGEDSRDSPWQNRSPSDTARRPRRIVLARRARCAGTRAAHRQGIPRSTTKNSKSYEEIVRQTVLDPDSSKRPTLGQEQAAREGFRALD